jgi:hypothetical protein
MAKSTLVVDSQPSDLNGDRELTLLKVSNNNDHQVTELP